MGRWSPRRERSVLALWSLALVVVTAALALATNVASSSGEPWPWGLEVFRRYPWQAFGVLIGSALLLTLLTLRHAWRAEDAAAAALSTSPEALNGVVEALAVALRDEIDDEMRTRALGRWIDLPVRVGTGASAERSTLSAVVSDVGRTATRVVVAGTAGSGKSTALMTFTRRLLGDRAERQPVPVLVNLSTWDPAAEGFDDVVRRRLGLPVRRRPARRGRKARLREPVDVVSTRRVLPVLDGLDELPESRWPAARAALARTLDSPDRAFVLACTSEAFDALVPEECLTSGGTRVVTLAPLDVEASIAYLATASGPDPQRWDAVFDRLRAEPGGVLAHALSSPLLLHLALVVYRDRRSDPAELADEAAFPTSGEVERHLLSHYLASAYGNTSERVHRWIGSMARLLTFHHSTEFVWWAARLPTPLWWSTPRAPRRLAGSAAWRSVVAKLKPSNALAVTAVAAAVGVHVEATRRVLERSGDRVTVSDLLLVQNWLVIGSCYLVILVLRLAWVWLSTPGPDAEGGPRAQLVADRRAGVLRGGYLGAVAGGCGAVAVFLGWPHVADKASRLLDAEQRRGVEFLLAVPDDPTRWGFAIGAGAVLAVAAFGAVLWRTAWFRFRLACLTGAALGRTPLRLVAFLEEAHERGVLRRNGAAYGFRHRAVQWHFARPLPSTPVRQMIAELEESHDTDGYGKRAALRRLETAALYEPSARAAWHRLGGGETGRKQALLPHVKATRTAIQWWTAVIDSGAAEAVVELSDLYEWLIGIQPTRRPGPMVAAVFTTWAESFWSRHVRDPAPIGDHVRAAWSRHFDSDPPDEQPCEDDSERTISWTEQGQVTAAVERALRTAALWQEDGVVHTGAVFVALAEHDHDGDWDGLWDCLGDPDPDDLVDAEDPDDRTGGSSLTLDDGTFTARVSGHVAGALTSAARTAARHDVAPMSPGLLALALVSAEGSAAREVLLTHSGLDHAELPAEAFAHLVDHDLPDQDGSSLSSDHRG